MKLNDIYFNLLPKLFIKCLDIFVGYEATTKRLGRFPPHTQRLWVHDERMGAGGHPGATDLDEDAVALIVILAVTVGLLQQRLRVADLTSDAAARHRLEVGTRSKRLCAELLNTDST